ncbi:NOC3 domain-containing protein [Plasmodium brasilianum]|uniref:NOC3 domain-containing protein n=1 Tax=Plasmodium brasilianum TaxID=5824 RepID=A0ACB9Y4V7_PLABR|nr:NOC3 domain-containing protein [Plasmodium brasilianum]
MLAKMKLKKKKNEEDEMGKSELGVRTFNIEVSEKIRRENFNLPKIKRNGMLTYEDNNDDDNDNDDDEIGNRTEEQKKRKSKKIEREKLKLRKMLDKIKKKKKEKIVKSPIEEEMLKISNKMKHLHDIKNEIATISNSIIGDQNLNIDKMNLLFYIFNESLKRKKELSKNWDDNRSDNNSSSGNSNSNINSKSKSSNMRNDNNTSGSIAVKKKIKYYEHINLLSCISICTVLKYITPSYKILKTDYQKNDKSGNTKFNNHNSSNGLMINYKKKSYMQGNSYSNIVQTVNMLEKNTVKYFKDFCVILKGNIRDNITVYVNLLCDIVTVNLNLSKDEKLFEYLLLYSNIQTYSMKKYNRTQVKNKKMKGKHKINCDILCMKCLNTVKEIIDNDNNLSITLYLIDHFVNIFFKKEKYISPNLLKIFSKICIGEKKMNAKLYSMDDIGNAENNEVNKELRIKTNISGELKIMEKNIEKILDQLFLVYLCILREYNKYSTPLVKNVLHAISYYALYVNKILMDDVFKEIKSLATANSNNITRSGNSGCFGVNVVSGVSGNSNSRDNRKIVPSCLILTSIHIFLETLNKVNDSIYIDCSWIAVSLLNLLESAIPFLHSGSAYFLLEQRNFMYNSFQDCSKFSSYLPSAKEDHTVTSGKGQISANRLNENNCLENKWNKEIGREEKYNFCSELLYCIDLLLKTKNFTYNYNNFKSTNNQLLSRIVYQLCTISLHADYVISFSILKLVQNILIKYPLVKPVVEKEGTVIFLMNDTLSTFFQNTLFHSCFFNDISSLAMDISLNDSNEEYTTTLQNYIHQNKSDIQNKIINLNFNLNEQKIINRENFEKYDPYDVFYKNTQKHFRGLCQADIGKNFKNVYMDDNFFLSRKSPSAGVTLDTNASISVNQLPPYMLTAIDFIEIVFSPYEELIKYFQKEQGEKENIHHFDNAHTKGYPNSVKSYNDQKHNRMYRKTKGKNIHKKKGRRRIYNTAKTVPRIHILSILEYLQKNCSKPIV